MVVYVINGDGKPLMPCKPRKARLLLKAGRARVARRFPFVIKLNYTSHYRKVQDLTLGLDTGFENVGVSVVNDETKGELFCTEGKIRTDVSKRLLEKRMYRRTRRGRKTRYREPRFLNRGSSKRMDLVPSIQHKVASHVRLVNLVKKWLPITRVIVEKAVFDIQKIKDMEIERKDYQEGPQLGFQNVKEYVLYRDGHVCQHCKGKSDDKVLVVHHIRGKMEGATNRPEELLTVCKSCHINHHNGINSIAIPKRFKTFKPETVMNIVCNRLAKLYSYTYGYITKCHRKDIGLKKSHVNDAYVIAGG